MHLPLPLETVFHPTWWFWTDQLSHTKMNCTFPINNWQQILPDIQEILVEMVTNMLCEIQTDMAQHSQMLDILESRLQLLEIEYEEMQSHVVLQENKRLGDKVEDLGNRLRLNNLRSLGVALCEQELPAALDLPRKCKVERAWAQTCVQIKKTLIVHLDPETNPLRS